MNKDALTADKVHLGKKPPAQASKREAYGGVKVRARAWEAGAAAVAARRAPRPSSSSCRRAGDHLEQVVDDAVDKDAADGDGRAW